MNNIVSHNLPTGFTFRDINNGEAYYHDIELTTDYKINNVAQKVTLRVYVSNLPRIIKPDILKTAKDWDAAIKMIKAHKAGIINIKDYWKIGDTVDFEFETMPSGWPPKITFIIQGFDLNIYGHEVSVLFGMRNVVNIRQVNKYPYGDGSYVHDPAEFSMNGINEFIAKLPAKLANAMEDLVLYYTKASSSHWNTLIIPMITVTGKMLPYSKILLTGNTIGTINYSGVYTPEDQARDAAKNDILFGRNGNPPIAQLEYFKTASNITKYGPTNESTIYASLDSVQIFEGNPASPVNKYRSYASPSFSSRIPDVTPFGDTYFFAI